MIRILLKKQLAELFQRFFQDRKSGKRRVGRSATLIAVFFLILLVSLGGVFFFLAWSMRDLIKVGMDWLYFLLNSILALALGVFGSVFNTYASLYQAKDNDLLLSMPIPVRSILITRLLGVYLMGLLYSSIILLPSIIVYYLTAKLSVLTVLGPIVLLLLISVIALTLSCILGWIVAKISNRLKNKSLITVLISVAFFGAYMYFCSHSYELLEKLLMNSAAIGGKIRGSAYPLYLLGRVGTGDGKAMLLVGAVVLVLFALLAWVLSHSFLKIATASGAGKKARYQSKVVRARTVSSALLQRELRHYLSSPTYMLNCSIGTLFLLVLAVVVVVKRAWLRTMLPMLLVGREAMVAPLLAVVLCLTLSMNLLTAPSISLEGRSLWLLQSLPVTSWQALAAKLKLHLLLTSPATLIASVCLIGAMGSSVAEAALLLVLPQLYVLFLAALGLTCNLKLPNLNWRNETAAVKQGMPVLLTILIGWLLAGLMVAGCFFLSKIFSAVAYALLCTAVTAALCVGLLCWLRRRGCRILESL